MRLIVGVCAVLLLAGGYYWNEHRTVQIMDAINPAYWVRRWRNEDLYDYQHMVLHHGNHKLKEIALTIDDGPHRKYCPHILDILKQYDVHATFFVVGEKMRESPDLIRRMVAEGHTVANHTETHPRLDTLPPDQIQHELLACDDDYYKITGQHFTLMRPPGVRYNPEVIHITDELGYVTVLWNSAAKDFQKLDPEFIVDRVLKRTEPGSIILLHDHPDTMLALPHVLAALKKEGFTFVTIPQMLAHLPKPVALNPMADPRKRLLAFRPAASVRTLPKKTLTPPVNPRRI